MHSGGVLRVPCQRRGGARGPRGGSAGQAALAAPADLEADQDSAGDAEGTKGRVPLELVDVGGGGGNDVEEEVEDAAVTEVSLFPLRDHIRATELALQHDHLQRLSRKSRLSYTGKQLKSLDRTYGGMLQVSFSKAASAGARERLCLAGVAREVALLSLPDVSDEHCADFASVKNELTSS